MFLDMEDWSLQAIVRGSSGNFDKLVDVGMEGHDPFFSVSDGADDHQKLVPGFLDSFPEMFDVSIGSGDGLEELYKTFYPVGDELEELYKPFYPVQTIVNFQEKLPQNVCTEDLMKKELESDQSVCVARVTAEYSAKNKIRRRNQHKRVVVQVSAEGLSSDMWAWRKYGQKPIKGSPYPRSYYRCSSSKGCLARKQVEQSYEDPGMFIITYTAEHNHSKPTRRNSLAGTVRQKFPYPEKSTPISNTTIKEENTEELSSSTFSPKVPPQVSPSEEVGSFTDQARIKVEDKEEYEALLDTGESLKDDHVDFLMSDSVFNDDFFSGLEDFGEFISEFPLCHTSAQQFHLRSCS